MAAVSESWRWGGEDGGDGTSEGFFLARPPSSLQFDGDGVVLVNDAASAALADTSGNKDGQGPRPPGPQNAGTGARLRLV